MCIKAGNRRFICWMECSDFTRTSVACIVIKFALTTNFNDMLIECESGKTEMDMGHTDTHIHRRTVKSQPKTYLYAIK